MSQISNHRHHIISASIISRFQQKPLTYYISHTLITKLTNPSLSFTTGHSKLPPNTPIHSITKQPNINKNSIATIDKFPAAGKGSIALKRKPCIFSLHLFPIGNETREKMEYGRSGTFQSHLPLQSSTGSAMRMCFDEAVNLN